MGFEPRNERSWTLINFSSQFKRLGLSSRSAAFPLWSDHRHRDNLTLVPWKWQVYFSLFRVAKVLFLFLQLFFMTQRKCLVTWEGTDYFMTFPRETVAESEPNVFLHTSVPSLIAEKFKMYQTYHVQWLTPFFVFICVDLESSPAQLPPLPPPKKKAARALQMKGISLSQRRT